MEKTLDIESIYQPLHDRVLIEQTPPDQVKGGFTLTATEQEKKYEGTVRAVGTGVPLHNVNFNITADTSPVVLEQLEKLVLLVKAGRPMKVKTGDYVLFGQYAGTKVKIADKEYIMVREADIFCIIKKD